MLGVCLGHQSLAEAWGGRVIRAAEPMHGRASWVRHTGVGVFEGLPNPLRVGRYHSLVVDPASLPSELQVTAVAEDGTIMALAHQSLPVVGLQFHPESVLTQGGYQLLANYLRQIGGQPVVPAPDEPWQNDAEPAVEPTWPTEPISF